MIWVCCKGGAQIEKFEFSFLHIIDLHLNTILRTFYVMQLFDQRPPEAIQFPSLLVPNQVDNCVMYGVIVGCAVFLMHVYLIIIFYNC